MLDKIPFFDIYILDISPSELSFYSLMMFFAKQSKGTSLLVGTFNLFTYTDF